MWLIHCQVTVDIPNDYPIRSIFYQNLMDYNVGRTQSHDNRLAFHKCSNSIIDPDIVMLFPASIESRSNCHCVE